MRTVPKSALVALAIVPLLGACQTQEQTGALVGTAGGAVGGALIGRAIGGSTGAAIGALVGGGGGMLLGSAIGRRLDEQDRQRAAAATQQALAAPVYYPPNQTTYTPPPRPVTWNSAQNQGVNGSSTITSVQRQPTGGECRMVRETAYIKGEEVVQNNRYCQSASGEWVQRS